MCLFDIFTMELFRGYFLTFELILCTMYFTRCWINAVQIPVDQGHLDQLVAIDNVKAVTISNEKQIEKDGVQPDLAVKDSVTTERHGENVVTTDSVLTTQAVTHDNNVNVTTGVATATIPALQQNHHHDNDYIKLHQSGNLKPRSGIDLHNNQRNILLQHSETVEEFTSSDFVIGGRDITTSKPDGLTEQNVQDYQESQINRDQNKAYVTGNIQGLFLDSTTVATIEFSSEDKGELLDTTSISYSPSVRLEQGDTLTGFTSKYIEPTVQNAQSKSTVVDHTTSQPSLLITLLLSSTVSPGFKQENQANSSPGYFTLTEHDELPVEVEADPVTSLDKHTVTKRETPGVWDLETIVPSVKPQYLTTPKSESSLPSQPSHQVTTWGVKSTKAVDTSSDVPLSSSGSGDVIDNGLPGHGHTTTSVQGQPLTTTHSSPKTSQVAGVYKHVTTTMVYVAASDVTENGHNLFDGFDGLDGRSEFKVKDIILAVSGTVGCMLTVCMLVAFTRCCCKKEKDDDEEETGGASSGTLKALRSLKRKSKRSKNDTSTPSGGGGRESATDVTQVSVECHGEGKRSSWCHDDGTFFTGKDPKNNLLRGSQNKEVSVKDRIKAFESKTDHLDVKLRDDGKPRKKKPKSKAFEDFESQGILIGFGNVPRKRPPDDTSEDGTEEREDEREEDEEEEEENQFDTQLNMTQSFTSSRGSGDVDDDDFEAVQRNTEILKSFRRAPPPKNRSRARRSGRRARHRPAGNQDTRSEGGRDTGDGASVTEGGSVYSAPVYRAGSQDSELDQFEASLHMPVDRSHSAREMSRGQGTPRITPRESPQGRTVTIQVPQPLRTSNNQNGGSRNYSNNGFSGGRPGQFNVGIRDPVTATRIQPDGASEHEPCDLDFRQRCYSDSRSGSFRNHHRPMSCYTSPSGGERVTGLPPKGIPKSYSQRLERSPPPMDSYPSYHQGAPPYQQQLAPHHLVQVLPSSGNQQPAIDSLRHAMMRRWESEHSCLPGDTQGHMTDPYPITNSVVNRQAGPSVPTENIFEGHFPRSEKLARKFNSADSMDTLGKPDSPAHLNGSVPSDMDIPASPKTNGASEVLPPLTLTRYDYRHGNTTPRWEIPHRQSVFPMLAREIDMSESAERLPYTSYHRPTVKFKINTTPTNV